MGALMWYWVRRIWNQLTTQGGAEVPGFVDCDTCGIAPHVEATSAGPTRSHADRTGGGWISPPVEQGVAGWIVICPICCNMVRGARLEDARISWAVVNLPIGGVNTTIGYSIERDGLFFSVLDAEQNLISREPSLFAARYKILPLVWEALDKGG